MGLMSWLRGGRSAESAPSRHPVAPHRDRGDRVDVHRLEPVQRSVTGQDLLINPTHFEAGLTTRQDTALGTPLGHLVSPEAPAGLVRGVADAAPQGPPPPAQRAVEMPTPARSGTRRGAVAVQRTYGEGLPNLTSAGPASASAGLPVRQLVGEQRLAPLAGNTEPAGPAPHAAATGPAVPAPGPPAPGAPSVQRTSADGPSRPAPPPSRRTGGLGAPLPGLPPTAQRRAVQPSQPPRAQDDSAPPQAHAPDPVTGPGETTEPPVTGVPGSPDAPSGTEAVAPLLGDAPLKPGGGAPAPDATPEGQQPAAPVQRAGTPPPAAPDRPTAPLLGDRPLPLRTADAPGDAPAVQRAAVSTGADGSAPGSSPFVPPPPDPPPAVAVRWVAADPDKGIAPGARGASAEPGALRVQRAPSAPAAPPRPAVPPVQRQTLPPPARPDPAAGRGPRVPASVRNAGAVAVAAGVAQRMADGSVVFPAAPRDGTSRPVVQRDSETAEEPPPPPLPEPDPEPGPDPEPPDATEQPAATTNSSVSPDGTPQAPPVTDELVRALYAPLSRLLKADLRLERERSGSLINTRH
ncbi:hypothetical protein FKN01_05195 [Streptomyces sp. 130]|uniref:hypothetical protein n=1 Tax=Streptomyces sp. 130 TaxID=2591006 RepID=UPI00117CCDC9|nr:hypothetical protein [Streptomyces sp. 130]TRV80678.1 hypothetical protein FKN01_05195 [Streptomyces sp. 130]